MSSLYLLITKILGALVGLSPSPLKRFYEHRVFLAPNIKLPDEKHKHLETYALVLGGAEGRVEVAAGLYQQGIVNQVIASGGVGPFTELPKDEFGNPTVSSEAEDFSNQLVALGVNRSDILLECNSKNTFENFRFTLDLLAGLYPECVSSCFNIVVVTSDFHLKRSVALLKSLLPGYPHIVNVCWCGAPYPECEPGTWWQTSTGREIMAKELVRLAEFSLKRASKRPFTSRNASFQTLLSSL